MTQLDTDTLRRALRTRAGDGHAGDEGAPLDVSAIVSRGRGLRRRRRLTIAAGSACVAAAVFGIATGITHLAGGPAGSYQPVLSPQPAQHGTLPGGRAPVPSPKATHPSVPTAMPTPTATASPGATPFPTDAGHGGPAGPPTGSPTGTHPGITARASSTAVPSSNGGSTWPTPASTATGG